jgi:hypothetical protein
MDRDPPANQPSQPTDRDVVTHAIKGKAVTTQRSSGTTAGGTPALPCAGRDAGSLGADGAPSPSHHRPRTTTAEGIDRAALTFRPTARRCLQFE